MGRMHSGRHGKSGSKKPSKVEVPAWLSYKPEEIEMLVVKLAKAGNSASKIGLTLRDSYGVPDVKVICKKSITEVLKNKQITSEVPEDLMALIRKYVLLEKHMETNHHDMGAKRGMLLTQSKINRLAKYYKSTGRLAKSWSFDSSKARLVVT